MQLCIKWTKDQVQDDLLWMRYRWGNSRPVLMSTQGPSVILKPGSKQTTDMTTGVAWRGTLRAQHWVSRPLCWCSGLEERPWDLIHVGFFIRNSQALLQPSTWSIKGTLRNAKGKALYQTGVWISLSQFVLLLTQNSVTLVSRSLNQFPSISINNVRKILHHTSVSFQPGGIVG